MGPVYSTESVLYERESPFIREAIVSHQYQLTPCQKRYIGFKRVIDTTVSAVALLVLAVPLLAICVLQKMDSPEEPIFFVQNRVGWHGKIFKIIKFRTLRSSAPHDVPTDELEHPEAYLSGWGRLLRKTSIDELPQLFNVLLGQMALVGARPLIPSEQPAQYLREFYGIYAVRPGITGLAQVNGRDALDDLEKVRYDRTYVCNICARLDLLILLKSIGAVARCDGVVEGKPMNTYNN